MKFISRNKYIFKLLVILALFYKNIFFYNSLCRNCCKENILDEKNNSKKGKTKVEEIKTEKGKEIKTEIKKTTEEIVKTKGEIIKPEKGKTKVKKKELEEVNVIIEDAVTGKKYLYAFSINIKGSDLKEQVAKNYKGKNIEIKFPTGKLCEGDEIFNLQDGEKLLLYIENEKK